MIFLPLPLGLEPLQLPEGRSHSSHGLVHARARRMDGCVQWESSKKKKKQNPLSNDPPRQSHQRPGVIQRFKCSNQLGEATLGTASKEAEEKSHKVFLLRTLNSPQRLLWTHLPHECARAYLSLLSFRSFVSSLSRCPAVSILARAGLQAPSVSLRNNSRAECTRK